MRILCAERRPSNQTLKHNSAYRPPVAAKCVTVATENLWSNVVRRSDGRIRHNSTRLAPGVDIAAVADCQIDLVNVDGVAVVAGCAGCSFQQLLVVRAFVLLMEASRQAKVGEFDMAFTVEEDVVGFNITAFTSISKIFSLI